MGTWSWRLRLNFIGFFRLMILGGEGPEFRQQGGNPRKNHGRARADARLERYLSITEGYFDLLREWKKEFGIAGRVL